MSSYKPLYISGNSAGLIESREEMILAADAYPVLENAFVWRERIKRKNGYQLLARLRRVFTAQPLASTNSTLIVQFSLESTAQIEPGSVVITDGVGNTFTDNGLGVFVGVPAGTGTINYTTSAYVLVGSGGALTITFAYFPCLPVMGIRTRELSPVNAEMTVFFDTKYAYNWSGLAFVEFRPGTVWTGTDSNFFWTTNYWTDNSAIPIKIFWATNFSGTSGDPIRYTNGTGNGTGSWINFAPQIDATPNYLEQCLVLLPFRGRLLAFNTLEGSSLATSIAYTNRIRWAAIGNPFSVASAIVTAVNPNAWRDDIRGQGGFLDIPTNEDIISVGFVRDNLVIYCERSTWQLRYTGRSIAPFQIEKVNTELGCGSTFSAIQFDTSLMGIGDKGVVECDSYQSKLIDIKIPDLVMQSIANANQGPKRVHGIRDFFQRIAYWIYPDISNQQNGTAGIYPNKRLVYNYENGSWAIFTDSLTTLGTFQPTSSRTWANTTIQWKAATFTWQNRQSGILSIVGGNQQGFIEYLDETTTNDPSLHITAITGNSISSTLITSPNHNLMTGNVVMISSIPVGTPFASTLNGNIFGVVVDSANTFFLNIFDTATQQFSAPQLDPSGQTYIGGAVISVRDNFRIVSKKFNFIDMGRNIQMGYIDLLMNTTDTGAISLNVYVDYDMNQAVNNRNPAPMRVDPFFNITIPTTASSFTNAASEKTNQRVYCPVTGNYLTLEYTLSPSQLNGDEQSSDVQVDMQILWVRPAGRIGGIG